MHALADTVEIIVLPGMARPGLFPAPVAFGGMGRPVNPDGYSDHFPIAVQVREAD